jgi:hypothetical protein
MISGPPLSFSSAGDIAPPAFGTAPPILGAEEIAFPIKRLSPPSSQTETLRIIRYDALPLLTP